MSKRVSLPRRTDSHVAPIHSVVDLRTYRPRDAGIRLAHFHGSPTLSFGIPSGSLGSKPPIHFP
jgi:hypothetical protein